MLAREYANNVIIVAGLFLSLPSVPDIMLRLHLCEPHDAEPKPQAVQALMIIADIY